LIDGRLVMEDREMTLIDEADYLEEARAASQRILGRINAFPSTAWPVR
jgi:hypothetical protein